jgi:TonB family protein
MHRWLQAAIQTRVDGEYEAQHGASRTAAPIGIGTVYKVAWVRICADAKTGASPRSTASAASKQAPKFTLPTLGRGFPSAPDYYPMESTRLGEMGAAVVRACVGKDGYLTAPPLIQRSSGSAYLDAAALQLARDGSGKYVPATYNGIPVEAWIVFRVTFSLSFPGPYKNSN